MENRVGPELTAYGRHLSAPTGLGGVKGICFIPMVTNVVVRRFLEVFKRKTCRYGLPDPDRAVSEKIERAPYLGLFRVGLLTRFGSAGDKSTKG
jgi:hypothetical protein